MKHHPKCECDLCFADGCLDLAESLRRARQSKSPLTTLPGWDHAEKLAREIAALDVELAVMR